METVESLFDILMKRQPELALHFMQAPKSLFEDFSNEDVDFEKGNFWWVDGTQAHPSWEKWLLKSLDHRLFLVFEDIGIFKAWFEQSLAAKLIKNSKVHVLCLSGRGAINTQMLREYIWTNPGFEAYYFDPRGKFSSFFDNCRHFVFHRKAVIHEMMKLGSWNWPHIFRRHLALSDEKRIPKRLDWLNIPVSIVGAGVSVQEDPFLLGPLKHRSLLISAGTAINVLEALGHSPHIAMTIDPFKAQYSRFTQVAAIETPLAAGWRSHYQAIDCMKGDRLLLPGTAAYPLTSLWENEWGYVLDGFEEGPNVVTTAMTLAKVLGSSELFLLGVDLCLRNNSLYGAGVRPTEGFYQPPEFNEDEVLSIKTEEKEVKTYAKWLGEAQWISEFAENNDPVFRNETIQLNIPNTIPIKTKDWIEKLIPRDYEGWLWTWLQGLDPVCLDNQSHYLDSLYNEIQKTRQWALQEMSSLEALLEPYDITLEKAPSTQMALSQPSSQIECCFEIFYSDLQDLELYKPLFENWLVCFDRVYGGAFNSLREDREGFLWLDTWFLLRKMDFFIQGLMKFESWVNEVRKGQFLSEVEGV